MNNKPAIFLTGATGLVGSYLLKIFLENGHEVYALARSKNDQSGRDRIINVLKFWDNKILDKTRNLKVIEGDITHKDLGIKKADLDILKEKIEEIYHSAAAINLDSPLNIARQINLDGTRNILKLAFKLNKNGVLKKTNHISTAYVCGDYRGIFTENNLDVGQNFITTYEQSKFEAEKLIHDYRGQNLWIDVFRPSIIVGDSKYGKITRFQNIYHFLYCCAMEIFDSLPIQDAEANLVPIDYLAESIYLISNNTSESNKTYHPFPNKSVKIEQIIKAIHQVCKIKMPRIVSIGEFDMNSLTPTQKAILKATILSFNSTVQFDSSYTNALLNKFNLRNLEWNNDNLNGILKYFVDKKLRK